MAYGIVIWHIQTVYNRLVKAFENHDVDYILKNSADLEHYVYDAHVPFHITKNYNGQLNGQKGIHAFWESRLPELFGDDYDYLVGTATYRYFVLDVACETVEGSFNALDSVLILTSNFQSNVSKINNILMKKEGKIQSSKSLQNFLKLIIKC